MMSRRNVSPLRAPRQEVDPRDQLLRKLKEDLIAARQKQKQLAIKESYLVQLIEKIRLLNAEIVKVDEEGKTRLDLSMRSAQDLKKQVEALRAQLRAATVELGEVEHEEGELRKLLNSKMIEIEKLKREGVSQHELKAQQEEALHDIRKLTQGLKDYESRLSEINRKVLEVKAYIGQIQQQNQQLSDQLRNYQQQNTGLDNNIYEKQQKIDGLQRQFSQRHEQIKKKVQNYIELEHQNQKNLKQARHKQNLLKIQAEKQAELASIIKKVEGAIHEKTKQLTLTRTQTEQIKRLNNDFKNMNNKLRQDLANCQRHLQNLLQHNAYIHQQMQNYLREDQAIVSIIRRKKIIPLNSYASLRSSRRPV